MKNKPLVSVLINNYNKENYCEKAVKSILSQTYNNIEIIFADDGSTDNSVNKIKRIKNKFGNKIKIIQTYNRGKIFSLNQLKIIRKSVYICKGEVICILDSDDFFKKNKIDKIVKFFKKNLHSEIVFDKPIIFKSRFDLEYIKNKYFTRSNKWPKFPPTSCISFKKESLKKNIDKIFFKNLDELWFDFRISSFYALKINQFNLINEHLTFYRQNLFNYDKKYKKFINLAWWKRRYQAYKYINIIDKNSYKKNFFSFDYIITFLINRVFI